MTASEPGQEVVAITINDERARQITMHGPAMATPQDVYEVARAYLARGAEIEALTKERDDDNREASRWALRCGEMRARAEAAERRNAALVKALEAFADCVFNDNGDMTVTPTASFDDYVAAYFAHKTALAPPAQDASEKETG